MDLLSSKINTYYQESFTGLTYTNEKISGKDFEDCVFEKCVFIECVFENCRFIDCKFSGCSISACKPYNSQFTRVEFNDSKIMGFDWTKAKNIRSLSFKECNVTYSNFSFIKIPGLKILNSTANEVNFNGADLTEGIFTGTDFSRSVFSNTNLSKADFRKAKGYAIDFNFNKVKKAKFSYPEALSLLNSLDIALED